MKKILFKHTTKLIALGALLSCPIASHATVVQDINGAMKSLLGHDPKVTSIYDAEAQGLDIGAPKFQPWSSSYWPDISGNINNHWGQHTKNGALFFDGNMMNFIYGYGTAIARVRSDSKDVCEKFANPGKMWSEDDMNKKLSPTEKYDLLLGDLNFTFTKNVMADIDFRSKNQKAYVTTDGKEVNPNNSYDGDDNTERYADIQTTYSKFDVQYAYRYWKNKAVTLAYWSGICDGWAPAAVTLPRPANPVTVIGALGHEITFYPDDLKALGDYLFARTNTDFGTPTMDYHFAGRACGTNGNPELIPDGQPNAGQVKDFRCNDVDAGVWHMSLLNRVGKDKMGFVFEIDNNRKINNHPLSNYSITYFNPLTGKTGTLADSVVARSAIKDSYANRRNPKGVSLVGVRSKFLYLNYQWAEDHHNQKFHTDGTDKDKTMEKEYTYDLELDAQGNILGGEWGDRSKEQSDGKTIYADQPDFLWMAAPQNLPHSDESIFTNMGQTLDPSNPRPFGNTKWAWDGNGAHLPADWLSAAKSDEMWKAPTVGALVDVPGSSVKDVVPVDAKDPVLGGLKPAQPLSNIVFYLFDQARDPNQN